jgi:hypothetical protein
MLTILQKEYSIDILDFTKWQEMVKFRATLIGKLSYYFGKIVAIIFTGRLLLSGKQIVQPVYSEEMLDKTTRQALLYFKLHEENTDDLALAVTV